VARLQNQLAEANIKILELEKQKGSPRSSEQAEIIASISQELRQPMSSIIGYTDLLLGESVGILGALQRKFVERIKASTERIRSLIDDLIQITTIESGLTELKPEPVDLNLVIDNAVAYTSSQIREKNITMHLDLPKSIAPIQADREALQQILIHLLQNAGAATPTEGTVSLRVQTRTDGGQEYVMIQVSDTGGGIPAEDLPRVFSRLYRADNVLIQGVGDTGVGLSIAKTLTEAQHGRIWVESEPGVGATFSVLLPVSRPATASSLHSRGVSMQSLRQVSFGLLLALASAVIILGGFLLAFTEGGMAPASQISPTALLTSTVFPSPIAPTPPIPLAATEAIPQPPLLLPLILSFRHPVVLHHPAGYLIPSIQGTAWKAWPSAFILLLKPYARVTVSILHN
jgi:nitrogen-specific signal transduction histidine kinase